MGDLDIVSGFFGVFVEDLEFLLVFGYFGIDVFVVDVGVEIEIEMFFDDFVSNVIYCGVIDVGVVWILGSRKVVFREVEWMIVLVKEIFLFEFELSFGIV